MVARAQTSLIDLTLPDSRWTVVGQTALAAAPDGLWAALRASRLMPLPGRLDGCLLPDSAPAGSVPQARRQDGEATPERGWTAVAERPGQEALFGAVAWTTRPGLEWLPVSPAKFRAFEEPGWIRLGADFRAEERGDGTTTLTLELRAVPTDERSATRLRRFWPVLAPLLSRLVTRQLLSIEETANSIACRPT